MTKVTNGVFTGPIEGAQPPAAPAAPAHLTGVERGRMFSVSPDDSTTVKIASIEVPAIDLARDTDTQLVSPKPMSKDFKAQLLAKLSNSKSLDNQTLSLASRIFTDIRAGFGDAPLTAEIESHLKGIHEEANQEVLTRLVDNHHAFSQADNGNERDRIMNDKVIHPAFLNATVKAQNLARQFRPTAPIATADPETLVTSILNRTDVKTAIQEFAEEAYELLIPGYQRKSNIGTEEDQDASVLSQNVDKGASHTVTLLDRNVQGSNDRQVGVAIEVEVLGKIILIENSMLERMREERSLEKKEQQLQDLMERIKHQAIMGDVLKHDIQKVEVSLQELKGRISEFVEIPAGDVKITQMFNKAGKVVGGQLRLRLPGNHEIRALNGPGRTANPTSQYLQLQQTISTTINQFKSQMLAASTEEELSKILNKMADHIVDTAITKENYPKQNADGSFTPRTDEELAALKDDTRESVRKHLHNEYLPSNA